MQLVLSCCCLRRTCHCEFSSAHTPRLLLGVRSCRSVASPVARRPQLFVASPQVPEASPARSCFTKLSGSSSYSVTHSLFNFLSSTKLLNFHFRFVSVAVLAWAGLIEKLLFYSHIFSRVFAEKFNGAPLPNYWIGWHHVCQLWQFFREMPTCQLWYIILHYMYRTLPGMPRPFQSPVSLFLLHILKVKVKHTDYSSKLIFQLVLYFSWHFSSRDQTQYENIHDHIL